MPFDVLGRTRATLSGPPGEDGRKVFRTLKFARAGDGGLQLSLLNEEYLVSVSHQLALNTSLPFVHTARRSYRLGEEVRTWEVLAWARKVSELALNSFEPYHLEEGEVVTRFP